MFRGESRGQAISGISWGKMLQAEGAAHTKACTEKALKNTRKKSENANSEEQLNSRYTVRFGDLLEGFAEL